MNRNIQRSDKFFIASEINSKNDTSLNSVLKGIQLPLEEFLIFSDNGV